MNQTDFIIGLDSFAEATVLKCPDLLDKIDKKNYYYLIGYDNKKSNIKTYSGFNHLFGEMLYDTRIEEDILLSYICLYKEFHIDWINGGAKCIATSKVNNKIVLIFELNCSDRYGKLICKGMPSMDASHMWRNLIYDDTEMGKQKKIHKTIMCLDNINAVPPKM